MRGSDTGSNYKKQRSKSTISFYHQAEIDNFNKLRRGYASPMPGFEEDFFVEMLKGQYQLELALERFKQRTLLEQPDFNPIMAWRLFEPPKDRLKNLNCHNIMAAFRNLRLKFTMADAKLLLLRFDDDRDGLLSFTDIRNIFSPNDPSISGQFKKRLPDESQRSSGMSTKTRESMRHILQQVIRVERNIESFKKKIQQRQRFDLDAAFQAIMRVNPTANEECISPDDFKKVLKAHGLFLLDRDVSTLYGRYDKDMNGNINFKDFASEMLTVTQNDHVREGQVLPGKQYSRKDVAREVRATQLYPGSV